MRLQQFYLAGKILIEVVGLAEIDHENLVSGLLARIKFSTPGSLFRAYRHGPGVIHHDAIATGTSSRRNEVMGC